MSDTSSPSTTNSLAECSTSHDTTTASSPCLFDVPALDNDSSTVDSPLSGIAGPTPAEQTILNPEAAWFDFQPELIPGPEPICFSSPAPEPFYFGSPPPPVFFNDFSGPPSGFPLYQAPVPIYNALPLGVTTATTADDIKLILMGISSRLEALERAVVAVSVQMIRVERDLTVLGEKPSPEGAIEELKKSMKDFATALVLQALSGEAPTEGSVGF